MGQLNLGTGVTLKGTGAYLAQTGTSTPIVHANTPETSQGLTDATWTKNTWLSSETIDSDGSFSSSRFTVPAGRGGYYQVATGVNLYGNDNNIRNAWVAIYKNGSKVLQSYNVVFSTSSSGLRHFTASAQGIFSLNANDYIEQYMYCDVNSGVLYMSCDSNGVRGNFLTIYKL